MALLGGGDFDPSRFFREGAGVRAGSSVDLTIGTIFNSEGEDAGTQIRLRPGQQAIAVSKEIFDLPNDVTAHLSHKATLSRRGIWAPTVGIVDPGWDGPVGTTLVNTSRQDFFLAVGAPFLRASFLQHRPVDGRFMRRCRDIDAYVADLRSTAATQLPASFLDGDKITAEVKRSAVREVGAWALGAIAVVGSIVAIYQTFSPADSTQELVAATSSRVKDQSEDIRTLKARLDIIESDLSSRGNGELDGQLRGLTDYSPGTATPRVARPPTRNPDKIQSEKSGSAFRKS